MTFEQTRRTLSAMKLRTTAILLLLSCLAFSGWLTWLFLGRVDVYVKSSSARLEVMPPPMPINAAVDGVVVECRLSLGAKVEEREVLVRLDARAFELQAEERSAVLNSHEGSLAALRSELTEEQKARAAMTNVVANTERTGALRVAANQVASKMKAQENDVVARLSKEQLTSKLDSLRSSSEAETQRMQADVSSGQAALETSTARMTLQDRVIRIASLSAQIADATSAIEVERARLHTIEYEIERRTVRALAPGVITDVIACSPGMTVTSTTRLGTVLPHGDVRVVAYFAPQDAVGRVTKGQSAIVRVENFPWPQYGTLQASVYEVGSEPREGLVRTELTVVGLNPQIPAIHGLVATAEVRTERLSPAHLLLRMAGQLQSQGEPVAPPSFAARDALVSK